MYDKTTDISNQEQAVICIRTAENNFEIHEDFIGLYQLDSTKSDLIVKILLDVLLRINLSVSKLRGQSYDGAANMSGSVNGVAKQIQNLENRALYIHCNGHLVNLATSDCVKKSKVLQEALEYAFEIIKLIKLSPKREAIFKRLKKKVGDTTVGLKSLCLTQWTVKANSLFSIIENYQFLIQAFEEDLAVSKSMRVEMQSRINGMISIMNKFSSFFGFKLAYSIPLFTKVILNV